MQKKNVIFHNRNNMVRNISPTSTESEPNTKVHEHLLSWLALESIVSEKKLKTVKL